MAPPMPATILPSKAWAAGSEPAATTVPAPSLPTGSDWSARPAIARISWGGTVALSVGPGSALAVDMSAAPSSRPRSDGLIGEASTRTSTSSAASAGISTLTSETSNSPLALISERS